MNSAVTSILWLLAAVQSIQWIPFTIGMLSHQGKKNQYWVNRTDDPITRDYVVMRTSDCK
jgi:hypothetical protein